MNQRTHHTVSSCPRSRTITRLLPNALVALSAICAGLHAQPAAAQSSGAQSISIEAIDPDGSWITFEPGQGTHYLPEGSLVMTPWGTTDEGYLQVQGDDGDLLYDIRIGSPEAQGLVGAGRDPTIDSDWYGPLLDVDYTSDLTPYGGADGLGLDPGYIGGYPEASTMPELDPSIYVFGIPTDVPGISVSFGAWSMDDLSLFDPAEQSSPNGVYVDGDPTELPGTSVTDGLWSAEQLVGFNAWGTWPE